MSVHYYTERADDWEATCVGSAARFVGRGGGAWAVQFRSPTVCPKPVLFVYAGGGIGAGGMGKPTSGVSGSEDAISTSPVDQTAKGGFSKLVCDNSFSLSDLNGTMGRLTVGECYVFGVGGGVVIISAFTVGTSYFNSQEIWGSGISPTIKRSCGAATTVGIWKSEFVGHLIPSRGSKNRSDDSCSIHDLPRSQVDLSMKNYSFPKTLDGPAYRSR